MAKGPQPPGRNRSKSPNEQSKTGSENAKPGQSQEDLLEEVYLAHGKIIKGWAGGSKVGNLLAEYEHLLHLRDPENRNLIHRTIQELQTKKKNAPQEALERIESLVLDDPKLFTAVDDYGKTPMLEAAKHQVTILFRVVNLLIPYSTLEKIKIKCGEDQETCPLWEVGEIYRKRCLKESKSRQVNGADGTSRRKNIGTSTVEAGSKDDDHPCLHDQVDPDKVIAKNKQLREVLEEALKPTDEGQAVFLQSLLAEMRFDPGPKGIGQLISLQSFRLLLELCDDNVFTSIHQNGYSPLQTAVQLYEKQSIDYDLLFQAIQALVDRNPSSIFFKTEDGKAEKTAYRMLKELDEIASNESKRSRNLAEELLKRTCIGYRPKLEEENTMLEEEKTGRRFRTSAQREKIKRLEELDMWAKKKDFLYWDAKFEPQLTFKIEKQFYLNLSGESVVLDKSYIETIMEQSGLEFETVLNFVKLPYWKPQSSKPQVDPHDIPVEDDDTEEKEISQNTVQKIDPDPYKAIFEWLWKSNVRKIFTVEVDDDGPEPHTNAAIRQSLRGEEPETKPTRDFDVEIWKWKKFDICSETIVTTASNAREIHLYSHGNTAVLRGWACSSGLARLQQLEKLVVNIYPTNLNDERDCERYKEEFRRKIASHSSRLQYRDIGVEIYGYKYGEDGKADKETKKDSKDGNKLYNPENLPKPIEWIRQLKNFKSFMLNLHLPERNPTVKVAILDDGAKLTNLRGYQKGLSFCAGNEWFVGPCEHGTAMAHCIRAVCPRAELFIARLDDMRQVEDQTFTLVSCYDALKWALDMQVDIISMSWTFLMKGNLGDEYETKFIQLVREAVASRKFILFGALPDKGIATKTNEYAPVGIEGVIKIGSATKYGESSKENVLAKFDFLLPGEDIQTDTGDTVRGSSYATAYAAGLAAMVLYCVKAHRMLNDFSDGDHMAKALDIAKDVDGMKKIFKRLSRTSSDDVAKEGAFIQPYFTFGQDFEEQEEAKKTNLNSIMNAILPIDVLRAFKQ